MQMAQTPEHQHKLQLQQLLQQHIAQVQQQTAVVLLTALC